MITVRGKVSMDANLHPRRAIGAAQRRNIEARLKRHNEIMQKLMKDGMEKEAASNKAYEMLLAEEKERKS